jgi:hypothetical protein
MKFTELADKDKIRHVKDKYAEILGEIVADKSNLDKLIPEIKEEPVFVRPKLLEGEDDADKKNQALLKTAQDTFAAKQKEFEDRKNTRTKILETLSKIKEKEDCICEPRELDIDINYIVPEFEIFIDFARVRAEAQNY